MISKQFILNRARENNLNPSIVEKDYVLGWILAAIYQNPFFAHTWIFKGGTCLKKCFFREYRFSEDLDFTVNEKSPINLETLKLSIPPF